MRKRRFLAMLALVISMSMAAPAAAFGTEVDDGTAEATVNDGDTEGEQTTAPEDETSDIGGNTSSTETGQTSSAVKSSDSSLSHLGISPGSLSPSFAPGTHEYTATVDADVTRISVAAKPTSSKAVIASVNGAKSIRSGTNTVTVVVEAENGATTTYTISVICGSATSSAQSGEAAAGGASEADTAEAAAIEGSVEELTGEETDSADAVTFDDNGYLIYEGESYIPQTMMPEGEYVSLTKYNALYDSSLAQNKSYMRLIILLVIVVVVLVIVLVNLIFKLRDLKADAALGLSQENTADTTEKKEKPADKIEKKKKSADTKEKVTGTKEKPVGTTETGMIGNLKISDKKPKKNSKNKEEDFEILDLNDL